MAPQHWARGACAAVIIDGERASARLISCDVHLVTAPALQTRKGKREQRMPSVPMPRGPRQPGTGAPQARGVIKPRRRARPHRPPLSPPSSNLAMPPWSHRAASRDNSPPRDATSRHAPAIRDAPTDATDTAGDESLKRLVQHTHRFTLTGGSLRRLATADTIPATVD